MSKILKVILVLLSIIWNLYMKNCEFSILSNIIIEFNKHICCCFSLPIFLSFIIFLVGLYQDKIRFSGWQFYKNCCQHRCHSCTCWCYPCHLGLEKDEIFHLPRGNLVAWEPLLNWFCGFGGVSFKNTFPIKFLKCSDFTLFLTSWISWSLVVHSSLAYSSLCSTRQSHLTGRALSVAPVWSRHCSPAGTTYSLSHKKRKKENGHLSSNCNRCSQQQQNVIKLKLSRDVQETHGVAECEYEKCFLFSYVCRKTAEDRLEMTINLPQKT